MQKEEKVIAYYQDCRGWQEVQVGYTCEQKRERETLDATEEPTGKEIVLEQRQCSDAYLRKYV